MGAMLSLAEVKERAAKMCLEASLPEGDHNLLDILIGLVDVADWPMPEKRPACLHSPTLLTHLTGRPADDLRSALGRLWKAGIVGACRERGFGYKCIDLSALRPFATR